MTRLNTLLCSSSTSNNIEIKTQAPRTEGYDCAAQDHVCTTEEPTLYVRLNRQRPKSWKEGRRRCYSTWDDRGHRCRNRPASATGRQSTSRSQEGTLSFSSKYATLWGTTRKIKPVPVLGDTGRWHPDLDTLSASPRRLTLLLKPDPPSLGRLAATCNDLVFPINGVAGEYIVTFPNDVAAAALNRNANGRRGRERIVAIVSCDDVSYCD